MGLDMPADVADSGVRLRLPLAVRYDDATPLFVEGLAEGAAATLHLQACCDSGVPRFSQWPLDGRAPRDAEGRVAMGMAVDLAPLLHALAPADPAGYLASLDRSDGATTGATTEATPGATPGATTNHTPSRTAKFLHASLSPLPLQVTLMAGPRVLAQAHQQRHLLMPGVQRETVRGPDDVRGEFFLPAAGPSAPGVLLLAGSGGGLDLAAAALLASCGYAVFTQGLFAHDDLPPHMVDIPVERVCRGLQWLARRLGHRRIVLRGISKGSEAAFRAARALPDHVAGLVLWVPSPMTTTGRGAEPGPRALLTEGGLPVPHARPLPDEPPIDPLAGTPAQPLALTPSFERQWKHPAHAAFVHPVEQLACPTLVVSAGDDRIWPSALAGEMLLERHRSHGGSAAMEHHSHPGAGHGINLPMTSESLSHLTWHPRQKLWLAVGGTPASNGQAAGAAWQRLHRFIDACAA
jgi:dienelactone hydrolase